MKNFIFLSSLMLCSSVWSRVSVEEILKKESTYCSDKFKSLDLGTLKFKSPLLNSFTSESKNLVKKNNFFHFTNAYLPDVNAAELLTHQFQNPPGIAGHGFYVSANPVSSNEYGISFFQMKIHPKARVLVFPANMGLDSALANQHAEIYQALSGCSNDFIRSLILEKNEIDVVYYNLINQWLLVLNDEVIEDLTFNHDLLSRGLMKILGHYKSGKSYGALNFLTAIDAVGSHSVREIKKRALELGIEEYMCESVLQTTSGKTFNPVQGLNYRLRYFTSGIKAKLWRLNRRMCGWP